MRIASLAVPFAILSTLAVACGGATNADVGGDPDASSDSASNGDGGCINPTEGQACAPADRACSPGGDICCIGYAWLCDGSTHKWTKAGVGCACLPPPMDAGTDADAHARNDGGPWACGTTTCSAAQFCEDHPPGIRFPDGGVPPDAYDCTLLPQACRANPTCACVKAAIGNTGACMVASCDESDGHVEVHCLGV